MVKFSQNMVGYSGSAKESLTCPASPIIPALRLLLYSEAHSEFQLILDDTRTTATLRRDSRTLANAQEIHEDMLHSQPIQTGGHEDPNCFPTYYDTQCVC